MILDRQFRWRALRAAIAATKDMRFVVSMHALDRIRERCQLAPHQIIGTLRNSRRVFVGCSPDRRLHVLLYSIDDGQWFIAFLADNGYVVSVITRAQYEANNPPIPLRRLVRARQLVEPRYCRPVYKSAN